NANRGCHLFFKRRQRKPGHPERRRCPDREDLLAGTKHPKGDVCVGGSKTYHTRSGRQPDDRAPFDTRLSYFREVAAADASCLDAPRVGGDGVVYRRPPKHDGRRPELTAPQKIPLLS